MQRLQALTKLRVSHYSANSDFCSRARPCFCNSIPACGRSAPQKRLPSLHGRYAVVKENVKGTVLAVSPLQFHRAHFRYLWRVRSVGLVQFEKTLRKRCLKWALPEQPCAPVRIAVYTGVVLFALTKQRGVYAVAPLHSRNAQDWRNFSRYSRAMMQEA